MTIASASIARWRRERLGAPDAAGLLVGGEDEQQPARAGGVGPPPRGHEHRRDRALHVRAAEPVGERRRRSQLERVGRPLGAAVADRLGVEVPAQRERPARSRVDLHEHVRPARPSPRSSARGARARRRPRARDAAISASPTPGVLRVDADELGASVRRRPRRQSSSTASASISTRSVARQPDVDGRPHGRRLGEHLAVDARSCPRSPPCGRGRRRQRMTSSSVAPPASSTAARFVRHWRVWLSMSGRRARRSPDRRRPGPPRGHDRADPDALRIGPCGWRGRSVAAGLTGHRISSVVDVRVQNVLA